MSEKKNSFIQVEHLQQYFPAGGFGKNKKYIQAVDDVRSEERRVGKEC